MEALLTPVLDQVQAVQVNASQQAETINNHSISIANHSTSLATLLDSQSKQQEEINWLKESNSNLTKDLCNHTVRIAELEEIISKLTTTTKVAISDSHLLKNTNQTL